MKKRPPHGREAEPGSGKSRPAKGSASHPEDIALWHYTTRSIAPLKRAKARVPEVGAPPEVRPKPAPAMDKSRATAAQPASPKPTAAPRTALPKSPPPKSPPPLVPIERRKARRIARGHVEIDARLDLHGLRQADAGQRLRTFLLRARADGLRTVLIITGKGMERHQGDESSLHDRSARGVLRRSVPLWLEAPELRACVAGIAPAHIRHGGSGALYIHLRKPRGR
jgi:DNA-nicking Smr family endonuclease